MRKCSWKDVKIGEVFKFIGLSHTHIKTGRNSILTLTYQRGGSYVNEDRLFDCVVYDGFNLEERVEAHVMDMQRVMENSLVS